MIAFFTKWVNDPFKLFFNIWKDMGTIQCLFSWSWIRLWLLLSQSWLKLNLALGFTEVVFNPGSLHGWAEIWGHTFFPPLPIKSRHGLLCAMWDTCIPVLRFSSGKLTQCIAFESGWMNCSTVYTHPTVVIHAIVSRLSTRCRAKGGWLSPIPVKFVLWPESTWLCLRMALSHPAAHYWTTGCSRTGWTGSRLFIILLLWNIDLLAYGLLLAAGNYFGGRAYFQLTSFSRL